MAIFEKIVKILCQNVAAIKSTPFVNVYLKDPRRLRNHNASNVLLLCLFENTENKRKRDRG